MWCKAARSRHTNGYCTQAVSPTVCFCARSVRSTRRATCNRIVTQRALARWRRSSDVVPAFRRSTLWTEEQIAARIAELSAALGLGNGPALLEEMKIRRVCRQLRYRDGGQRYGVVGIEGNYCTRGGVVGLTENLRQL